MRLKQLFYKLHNIVEKKTFFFQKFKVSTTFHKKCLRHVNTNLSLWCVPSKDFLKVDFWRISFG